MNALWGNLVPQFSKKGDCVKRLKTPVLYNVPVRIEPGQSSLAPSPFKGELKCKNIFLLKVEKNTAKNDIKSF